MKTTSDIHIYKLLEAKPELAFINAGFADFKIKITTGLKVGEHACWGICDFDTYEILVEKKMDDAVARETILHEICHMLLEFCGLGGSEEDIPDQILVSNEKLTITMSRAMLMFARLNPELTKLLLLL